MKIKTPKPLNTTVYKIGSGAPLARIALVADLHDRPYAEVVRDAPIERTAASAPIAGEGQQWVSPAYAPRTPEVAAPRTTPAFAAAPSGSMGRHEAMAMAGPTPENPFSTLSKRLARARFLDRQERAAYDATLASTQPAEPARKPVSAWEISQRQAPAMPAEHRRLEIRKSDIGLLDQCLDCGESIVPDLPDIMMNERLPGDGERER